jgi:S1-C subfamily serine protease
MRKPGDRVRLDILRDGKATSLTLVLGERGAAGAFED